MEGLLLLLAILPGIGLSYYIYYQDLHDKEPGRKLVMCFILGMFSTFPAIIMEEYGMSLGFHDQTDNLLIIAGFAFAVIAFSEEFVKFFILRFYAYPSKEFDEPMDGIVYAVMIGMGFATLENVLYAFEFGLGTVILRMLTAVPAHAAFAVLMGYYVGLAKFNPEKKWQLQLQGFFLAVLAHGAYDFFILQNNYPGLGILTFVTLFIAIHFSRKMIAQHQANSPFIGDEIINPQTETSPTISNREFIEPEISNPITDNLPEESNPPKSKDPNKEGNDSIYDQFFE